MRSVILRRSLFRTRAALCPHEDVTAARYRITNFFSTSNFDSINSETKVTIEQPIQSKADRSSADFIEIREGQAFMSYAKNNEVFYNKVQVFNRDLSILVVRLFAEVRQKEQLIQHQEKMLKYQADPTHFKREPVTPISGITILDALAASGLRSVRYLKEVEGIRSITVNDLLDVATSAAKEVFKANEVDPEKVIFHTGDAAALMYKHRERANNFDVIDLDPFGSSMEFLDPAVQAVAEGGLLCVTCTDMTALAGTYPNICYMRYGSLPLKSSYHPEMSLRILLHAIDTAANRHGKHIEPWISVSADFYVRVFVRVRRFNKETNLGSLKRMMVHQSTKCPSFHIQPMGTVKVSGKGAGSVYNSAVVTAPSVCEETGGNMKIGGPFWSGVLHDQQTVDRILHDLTIHRGTPKDIPTVSRMQGVLSVVSEELKDSPFYYVLPELFSCLHSEMPLMSEIVSAINNAGYESSRFHNSPLAIKTNAPNYVIWDIMRAYCRLNPPKGSAHKDPSPSAIAILSKVSRTLVSFKSNRGIVRHKARFLKNPEPNWGPAKRGPHLLKVEPRANVKAQSSEDYEPEVQNADDWGPDPGVRSAEGKGGDAAAADSLLKYTTVSEPISTTSEEASDDPINRMRDVIKDAPYSREMYGTVRKASLKRYDTSD